MMSRPILALGLFLAAAAVTSAQPRGGHSRAIPPDKSALDRLNLRTEWTLYLPIEGNRDSISMVQTFDDQLFIQTRTGLLIVVDVLTGRIQWSAALGNGGYTNVYGVAVNSQFVYVTNVTKLFAFYRYTGVTEFVTDMQTVPTTGLAADETGVYAVLAGRPGASASHRVVAFNLPHPIAVADAAKNASLPPAERSTGLVNPVDDLTRRYPSPGVVRTNEPDTFDRTGKRAPINEVPVGGMSGSRTPSLAALPRVTPPYTIEGGPLSPSLSTLPTLRQPYRLRDASQKDIQRTPSIGTIPPSVAAGLALADLRPRGVEPPVRWEYGLPNRVLFTPSLTPLRVWVATDSGTLIAISKVDKAVEVSARAPALIAAPPGRVGTMGYIPMSDGQLLAVELIQGNVNSGLALRWRAIVGGLMNRRPVLTQDAVYASGDDSGVARIDRATGDVIWQGERSADTILAINQEFVYIRDRQGRLQVYDARRATDPANRRSVALTRIDFAEFDVPIVNTVSDRLYLGANNGLIVCLRDASAKYARPVSMAPAVTVNTAPAAGVISPKDGKDAKDGKVMDGKDGKTPKEMK